MLLEEATLRDSVLAMFSDLLELQLEAVETLSEAPFVSACVHITGRDAVVLVVSATKDIARALSCQLLEVAPADVSDEDVAETFAELANILGGNIKGMSESDSYLSVPAVALAPMVLPTSPVMAECRLAGPSGGGFVIAMHKNVSSGGQATAAA